MISFKDKIGIDKSMAFEEEYEDALRMLPSFKDNLLSHAITDYIYVSNTPAGEIIGVPWMHLATVDGVLYDLLANEKGIDLSQHKVVYCYSTTVIKNFQHTGIGKLLKAHWLGKCIYAGATIVCGHSTSPTAISLNNYFGANHEYMKPKHNWFGSHRTAYFYEILL